MKRFLNISREHHAQLVQHLLPDDGKEAAAIALCGRCESASEYGLTVHELLLIPYEICHERKVDFIKWPTQSMWPLVDQAISKKMSIVRIHSHPNGGEFFSDTDDIADFELYNSIFAMSDDEGYHASLIMLPDGRLFGKFMEPAPDGILYRPRIDRIRVVGQEIEIWDYEDNSPPTDFMERVQQVFGAATTTMLRKMKIAVVGCSGTGTPTIEQLVRTGVGEIHLIDPDLVEVKNLNRMVNTKRRDVGQYKVEVLKSALDNLDLGVNIFAYPVNIFDDIKLVQRLGTMDFLFGCTDSADSRNLLNRISTFYLVPYIDMGVSIRVTPKTGIEHICGSVHYLVPGQSLIDRGLISSDEVQAASMERKTPIEFQRRKSEGYIQGAVVGTPTVLPINMAISALAVREMLARFHNFRIGPNVDYSALLINFLDPHIGFRPTNMNLGLEKKIGRGDLVPLLDLPELSQ